MMKILTSGASPFGAKVVMAAKAAGLDVELVEVDSGNQAPELLAANPLGKIPALVLNDGVVLYDSRTITRHFDRLSGGKLGLSGGDAMVDLMEAHWDGVSECAVAGMYEKRMRPEEKWHQPWLDRQWGKVERGLDNAPGGLPSNGADLSIGAIALAACLGYLRLRYGGRWEDGRNALVEWLNGFEAAHPDLAASLPHA